jgi:hypothetical protein
MQFGRIFRFANDAGGIPIKAQTVSGNTGDVFVEASDLVVYSAYRIAHGGVGGIVERPPRHRARILGECSDCN